MPKFSRIFEIITSYPAVLRDFIKETFGFIRQYPSILYSLVLLIALPLVLYLSTFYAVQSFKKIIDDNMTSQSSSLRDVLSLLVSREIPDAQTARQADQRSLQVTIDEAAKLINATGYEDNGNATTTVENSPGSGQDAQTSQIPDYLPQDHIGVRNIRVIIKEEDDYKIIAAQNVIDIGKIINNDPSFEGEGLIPYVWSNPNVQNSTQFIASRVTINNQKYWRLVDPLKSPDGETYAMIVADIPLNGIDRKISNVVWTIYAIVTGIIIITLFLVLQHTRLFTYVFLSKKLQEENKAKDNFIRMATHELRSPVTVITAYIQALREELAPAISPEQQQYVERVYLSIKNLSDLMSDILEVSHLTQNRVDFNPEKIAVGNVVRDIVEGIKQKAQEKGLSLTMETADFPYYINVNLTCFKRIITNLVENSVKYTPKGSVKVSINAEVAKKRVVIIIQDTGFGISAEGQKRLFEQFYRVKTNENSGIPGTGLGLWMSKQMAQKMKGDILVESIERIGSRFFVIFPIGEKIAAQPASPATPTVGSANIPSLPQK